VTLNLQKQSKTNWKNHRFGRVWFIWFFRSSFCQFWETSILVWVI
jgi:hypothetical protein